MTSRMTPALAALRAMSLATVAALALAGPASAAVEDGDSDSLAGTYLAARVADLGKDVGSAAAFYRDAHAADPENTFLLERAMALTAAAGDMENALAYARDLLKSEDGNRIAHTLIMADSIRTHRYPEAMEAAAKSGDGPLVDLTRTLVTAWALAGQGQHDGALAAVEALEGQSWYEPFKLLHGAFIADLAGREEEALRRFRQAFEQDRNAVRIAEAYARALARSGKVKDAEAVLTDYITRFPENPLAVRALETIKSGEPVQPTVRTPSEGVAEALSGLGAAVGQEGGLELGLLYLQLALHLEPQAAGGLAGLSLGNLFDANGQSEAAIETYAEIAATEPYRPVALLRAAVALDRLDRVEEAEKAFREAVARDPDDQQTYVAYGNMLRGRDRFPEAVDLYSRAIDRLAKPSRPDWSLFYFRGIAHERTKNWPKAEADFQRALELYPDQPLVLNYLGYSWVDQGFRLDEALAMIRKAVDLRGDDGYIVDSLGWAYYRLGRYGDAVKELERAVALRADDPVINDHLGDAYWKVGRKLEAQFQWRHARDLGAVEPELGLILRKIAEGKLIEKDMPVTGEAAPKDAAAVSETAPRDL